MIGLVLVTHGGLANEFLRALEHVVGPQTQIATLPIGADDNMQRRRAELLDLIDSVDSGDGVIVVTDMFGGTPCNMAVTAMGATGAEVLAGVNLPMLVKLAQVRRTLPLADAVEAAKDAAVKYIKIASAHLARC